MRAYRQTFRRHRLLLISPIIVAAAVGGYFTVGAPPMYRSSATLWVDNGSSIASSLAGATSSASATDPSSNGTNTSTTSGTVAPDSPAALESEVVSELLVTSSFDMAVAQGTMPAGARVSILDLAEAFSPADVSAVPVGPQVLKLNYDGPSPAVSRSALRSLIRQIGVAGSTFGEGIGKSASASLRHKLTAANALVAGNQGSLAAYVRSHPTANANDNATYRALAAEVRLAQAQRSAILAASRQANTEAQSNAGSATMKVLDSPSLPRGPATGLASKLKGVLGGAFAGLVLSLLALIVLTPRPPIRWDAEVPLFARIVAWDHGSRRRRVPSARAARGRAARPQPEMHPQQEGA